MPSKTFHRNIIISYAGSLQNKLLDLILFTILIFEKFKSPSGVKFVVPSSMNERSDKYIPRYGMQGGSDLKKI